MRTVVAAVILFLAIALPASAQTAQTAELPIQRADFSVSVGSFRAPRFDDELGQKYEAGLGVLQGGLYWTEHLKTEVALTWSATAKVSAYSTVTGQDSAQWYVGRTESLRDRVVSLAQAYQFRHNAWVHPYVAAGVDVVWQQHDVDQPAQAVNGYSPLTQKTYPAIFPAIVRSERTTLAEPFVTGGTKLYLSERAFVSTGLKAQVGSSFGRWNWNAGIGVDF